MCHQAHSLYAPQQVTVAVPPEHFIYYKPVASVHKVQCETVYQEPNLISGPGASGVPPERAGLATQWLVLLMEQLEEKTTKELPNWTFPALFH